VTIDRSRALRNLDLPANEVCGCHQFGDGMLDLDPTVQLEEVEIRSVDHELRSAAFS